MDADETGESMKLCKDCKHAVLPHPLASLAQYGAQTPIYIAMCSHPDAKRSVVDGTLQTTCESARTRSTIYRDSSGICADANLFEQAPPPEPPKPVEIETWEPPRTGFLERIFGRLM